MKKNSKKIVILLIAILVLTTGCTKTLKDENKKVVTNPETGQSLTSNILCRPTNKEIVEVIKKADTKKIHHPFKVGEKYTVSYFVYDEPNSFSSKGHTETKEYTVTKITSEKVTFKYANERAITKKPIRYANNGIVGFAIQLIHGRDGRICKEISKEEAFDLSI